MIIDSVTDPKEQAVLRSEFLYSPTKEDRRIIRSLSEEEYDSIFDRMKAIKETADQTHSDIIHMDRGKIAEMLHIPEHAPHYVETFTLDPSAKIITWKEVDRMMSLDKEHDFEWFKSIGWDEGVYAAMKGYDAINAVGHGKSGSYTVILNRTKLIILGNE